MMKKVLYNDIIKTIKEFNGLSKDCLALLRDTFKK